MEIKIAGMAVVIGLALSGCAAKDHYYSNGVCVTCINNPITGEPLNYDPNETPQQVATNAQGESVDVNALGPQRGSVDVESSLDVDTAYARIKPAFGFRAEGDFEQGNTMSKWQMGDAAWRHTVTPGSFYDLGDYGTQTLGGTQYSILQRVQIQKNGSGSRIHYSWAPADDRLPYDGNAMESALTQRLNATLN
ncbi:MAG: hypothetical protein CMN25_00670 [Salinicola sp.]|uniref:hypothetical protein n=1 Tax=uncultured Salinicola sp. TaxID=1193542 RepID=UPI000C96FC1C|nr:hypothetical protein [uncultured Salinicola sp.]MAM55836.1 hypothetical protein [Salinicola sp.]|tara:strand:- start:536 stop:1114 length:579 start_codon:yes stop_codon:yes gene_type:complete